MSKEEDLEKFVRAVDLWWRGRRPVNFDKRQHIKAPAINCITDREKRLAKLIAHWHIDHSL